jgi:monothiol glutaredoxin
MRKYKLAYEEKDIIKNPAFRWEMEQRSGQSLSPCVEINGQMLADVSGEEVERWMIGNGIVVACDSSPDAPVDASCSAEQHVAMATGRPLIPGKIRSLD